jgi:hypothetical protein
MLARVSPAAVFAADGEDPPAEIQLRELRRLAPFLPAVVLLKTRDASRAVGLMKAGALECAQPHWTAEALAPLLRRALNAYGTVLEPDSSALKSRRRRLALALAACGLLAGLSGGLYRCWRRYAPPPPPPKDAFALPYAHPTGVAPLGDSLLISDWRTGAIYEHELPDFAIKRVVSLPDTTPVAIAAGRDSLWLARADGAMERRLLDARFSPVAVSARFTPAPDSACFDGLYVWTADTRAGRITRRLPADALSELRSFTYPGAKLAAIACDSRGLWAADPGLKALVRMSLDDPETIISKTPVPAFDSHSFTVTAMGVSGGYIWFVGEEKGRGTAFRRPLPL